jgi:hypothetical protein
VRSKISRTRSKLKLDEYEGALTRRKIKQLHTLKSEELIHNEKDKLMEMAERNEEICEGPRKEIHEGQCKE